MSESELRCNNLKCRTLLSSQGKAVVTNCSHIFCISCANSLFTPSQICPACETKLTEPDDIIISSLSPTTDYKSSILAGLSPSIILEITTRALSFWTYQTSQEGAFQGMVLKNAQERLMGLERGMNTVNEELQAATNRISSLMNELEAANRKNGDLMQRHADKDREYTKLRMNYDKLKRKHLIGTAAQMADAVNDQVQHSVDPGYAGGQMSNNIDGRGGVGEMQGGLRPRSNGSGEGVAQRNSMMRSVMSTPLGQPQQFIPTSNARPHGSSILSDQTAQRAPFQPDRTYVGQQNQQQQYQHQPQQSNQYGKASGGSAPRESLAQMAGMMGNNSNQGNGHGFLGGGGGYGTTMVGESTRKAGGVIRGRLRMGMS